MNIAFYLAAAVALVSTIMVITRLNPVHALLYMVLSLLSVAVIFYTLGAPFIAALEVITYAGAIMVLFVFVVMLLNLGPLTTAREKQWLKPGSWIVPGILALVLLAELIYLTSGTGAILTGAEIPPKQLSIALFGTYLLGVELASLLLLVGLVGAYHLGRRMEESVSQTPVEPQPDNSAIGG
jgi:NADH-quinone oxidoreductase subunit J